MRKDLLSLLLVLPLVAGCSLIPHYETPEAPVPQEFPVYGPPAPSAGETQTHDRVPIAWTDFFQSEPLRNIIQTALDNNRDLRVAALNIDAARAAYRIERADILPSVEGNANATRQRLPSYQSVLG